MLKDKRDRDPVRLVREIHEEKNRRRGMLKRGGWM